MRKPKCKVCGSTMDVFDAESWMCPECGSSAYKLFGRIEFNDIRDDYKHETVFQDDDDDMYEID